MSKSKAEKTVRDIRRTRKQYQQKIKEKYRFMIILITLVWLRFLDLV